MRTAGGLSRLRHSSGRQSSLQHLDLLWRFADSVSVGAASTVAVASWVADCDLELKRVFILSSWPSRFVDGDGLAELVTGDCPIHSKSTTPLFERAWSNALAFVFGCGGANHRHIEGWLWSSSFWQ